MQFRSTRYCGICDLTREGFFNKLLMRYPQAVNCFFNWMDGYKSETKWDTLLAPFPESQEGIKVALDFDSLPFEMQIGIIIFFFRDVITDKTSPNFLNFVPINELLHNFETYVTWAFARLESMIEEDK